MGWSNDQFTGTLVIPTGATSGARIVLNGDLGVILVYDAGDNLIAAVAPASGTDSDGNDYPAGVMAQQGDNDNRATMSPLGSFSVIDPAVWDNASTWSSQPPLSAFGLSTIIQSASNNVAPGNAPTALVLDPGDQAGTPHGTVQLVSPGTGVDVDLEMTGQITEYNGNSFDTYAPVVTGGGTATFTNLDGWYQRVGKMVLFNAYIVVNAAGSGATAVSVTAPSAIDRSNRQAIICHVDGAAVNGTFTALCLTGGSGATIDRLRSSTNANLTGANLSAGAIITIQGWYRED